MNKPIYLYIKEAIGADGKLPEDFSLPKKVEKGKVRFADGAKEGIALYHMSNQKQDIKPVCESLVLASKGQYSKAEKKLQNFFLNKNISMISIVDQVQSWIAQNRQHLDPDVMHQFATRQLSESTDINCIKFAMSILELMSIEGNEELRDIILTFALSDEFTLFCLFLIEKWDDDDEVMFDIAKKVSGWGRIHTIEHICVDSDEVSQWILTEGYKNDIMFDYSALSCIEKGNLLELLKSKNVSSQQLAAANQLITIAVNSGGPVQNIAILDESEEIITQYLNYIHSIAHSFETINAIVEIKEFVENCEWDSSKELVSSCELYLNCEQTNKIIWDAIKQNTGFDIARKLGIECDKEIFETIKSNFNNNFYLIRFLMSNDIFVDEIIQLFEDNLPLISMATGADIELGLGKDFEDYSKLSYIVSFLDNYVGKGENLVISALNSPVISCRHKALDVVEKWQSVDFDISSELICAFKQLKASEIEPKIKERISKIKLI